MIIIFATGGKQYLAKPGQALAIEKIEGEKGGVVAFDKVLLTASDDGADVQIGVPYLSGVALKAEILEQGKGDKVLIYKYKPKTRYRRKRGHRQLFTKVKIGEVVSGESRK